MSKQYSEAARRQPTPGCPRWVLCIFGKLIVPLGGPARPLRGSYLGRRRAVVLGFSGTIAHGAFAAVV